MIKRLATLVSIVALYAATSQAAIQKLELVNATASETQFQLTLNTWKSANQAANNVLYIPVGANLDERAGGRITPYFHARIALPSPQKPTIAINTIQWGELAQGTPPEGFVENHLDILPLEKAGTVVLGNVEKWRRHWVVDVYVVPVQFSGNHTRKLETITFSLHHPTSSRNLIHSTDRTFNAIIANNTIGSNWTISRSRTAARKTSAEQSWPNGEMYRLEIQQEGMYQITSEDLIQAGIDPSGIDPKSLRIYGNGGQVLPTAYTDRRDSVLVENAIFVEGENDGRFDSDDRILFYARAVNTWIRTATSDYRHNRTGQANPYTLSNVYWLNIPDLPVNGKRMSPITADGPVNYETNVARTRIFEDKDLLLFNNSHFPESGRNWYTKHLAGPNSSYSSSFRIETPLEDANGKLWVSFLPISSSAKEATISINSVPIDTFTLGINTFSRTIDPNLLHNGINSFQFRLLEEAEVMFNWFEVSYNRTLEANDDKLSFDAFREDGNASVTLSNIHAPWIFDVQRFDSVLVTRANPFEISTQVNSPHRMIAVGDTSFSRILQMERVGFGGREYPNGLRDAALEADYIIIVHPDFYDTAAELEQYIEARDNIEVIRVKIDDIYTEFSWGLFDPVAIRDFLAYTVENWASAPQMVLLAGDGDYDYRNITYTGDKNWIPTYEDGLECRDDWYTTFGNTLPEIPIGRLTVQTNRELETYINKLNRYENEADYGDWRSRMVLVADDEYGESGPATWEHDHMYQAESFINSVAPEYLNVDRIYIGTYPTTYDASTGQRRKPLATRDIINSINRGALLVGYIGHGNGHQWAHEHVLVDNRDNTLLNSGNRLPIYIAATCRWGHFDRPNNQSHPEQMIVSPGGAIGIIAASRNTSPSNNETLTDALYSYFFDRENQYSMGEILLKAKATAGLNRGLHYNYFGEPMMRPSLPTLDMQVTSVNPNSLEALGKANVSGAISRADGTPLPDFDGEALVTVYDSADTLSYVFTAPSYSPSSRTLRYEKEGGTLFRGWVTAENGNFNANFVVPRDVKYGAESGRIQLYTFNEELDGVGSRNDISISLTSASLEDNTPPKIDIYFNDRSWRDGDLTIASPQLMVDVFDTNGVNLTGDIGHDIRAIIDGNDEIVLTRDFIYSRDSYTRGTAERTLFNLEPGTHRMEVWAWDNTNNFARKEISFKVAAAEGELALENVLNWPNPFNDQTNFTFELSRDAEITIKVFTASGRLIKEIGPVQGSAGFNHPENSSMELRWNGRDKYGDPVANGVYLYKIFADSDDGKSVEVLGKLLRIH